MPARVHFRPLVDGYELLEEIGRGGMGIVYKARQTKLNRIVALKMILGGPHASESDRLRFQMEIEATARLAHPNIVPVYEVGETADGFPFFTQEYVHGGNLSDRLRHGALPPAKAAQLVETLARAMQYAHANGIIHRDLKPANILVGDAGESIASSVEIPKIADFGLAKRLESDTGVTQTGAIMGTPAYMSPEQASGDTRLIGPLADVYALGAILYSCLTGRAPFQGATAADTLEHVRTREPAAPRSINKAIPRDLETICLRCLEKAPQKRYATVAALVDDLARHREGHPIAARPLGGWERAWRWCRRNPTWTTTIAAAAVLLLSVAGVSSYAFFKVSAQNQVITEKNAEIEATNQRISNEINQKEEQTRLAEERLRLAEVRRKHSLDVLGLFAKEARTFAEDAVIPNARKNALMLALSDHLDKLELAAEGDLGDDAFVQRMWIYQETARIHTERRKDEEARKLIDEGLASVEKRLARMPGDAYTLSIKAAFLYRLGILEFGRPKGKEYLTEALNLGRQLLGNPEVDRNTPGRGYTAVADCLDSLNRYDESLEIRKVAFEKIAPGANARIAFDLLDSWCRTCYSASEKTRDYDNRKRYLEQANELSEKLHVQEPTRRSVLERWSKILSDLGDLENLKGKRAEALKYFTKVNEVTRKLATSDDLLEQWRRYARSYYDLAGIEEQSGHADKALEYRQRALELRFQLLKDYGDSPQQDAVKLDWMISATQLGQHVEPARLADEISRWAFFDESLMYRLAVVYYTCYLNVSIERDPELQTDEEKQLSETYRNKALNALEVMARRKGGRSRELYERAVASWSDLRDDPRFKAIRDKLSEGLKTNEPGKRNSGSASVLKGKVGICHLFVEDKVSSWPDKDRTAVRARVQEACDFIAIQARRYNASVNFFHDYRDGLRYEPGLPTDMFADPLWTETVMRITGAVSGSDLIEQIKKKHQVEQAMVIIHVNKRGTSYSLAYHKDLDSRYAAERSVCFASYTDGRRGAAATIAHEILHGFGAGELYFPFDPDDNRKNQAKALFPDDVMLRVSYDIRNLNVGEFTAYRVGWRERLADELRDFEDVAIRQRLNAPFPAMIIRVADGAITYHRNEYDAVERKFVKRPPVTLPAAKDIKVVSLRIDKQLKKQIPTPIEGGLAAPQFTNIPENGLPTTIIRDAEGKSIVEIRIIPAPTKKEKS